MRSLKILVVVLGVLIVFALGVLAYGLATRVGRLATPGDTPAFGETDVDLPAGASVEETRIGNGRLVLRIRHADGQQSLMVFDLDTGRLLGTVRLKAIRSGR